MLDGLVSCHPYKMSLVKYQVDEMALHQATMTHHVHDHHGQHGQREVEDVEERQRHEGLFRILSSML